VPLAGHMGCHVVLRGKWVPLAGHVGCHVVLRGKWVPLEGHVGCHVVLRGKWVPLAGHMGCHVVLRGKWVPTLRKNLGDLVEHVHKKRRKPTGATTSHPTVTGRDTAESHKVRLQQIHSTLRPDSGSSAAYSDPGRTPRTGSGIPSYWTEKSRCH
jgi:hypothetical protein